MKEKWKSFHSFVHFPFKLYNHQSNLDGDEPSLGALSGSTEMATIYDQMKYIEMTPL